MLVKMTISGLVTFIKLYEFMNWPSLFPYIHPMNGVNVNQLLRAWPAVGVGTHHVSELARLGPES